MNPNNQITQPATDTTDYVTMMVGDILLGIDIQFVDEINRNVDVTPVPHAPAFVRGVLNLRGEVVTVVDLRMILGLPSVEVGKSTRTVIVHSQGEQIGLWIDMIADVVSAVAEDIEPLPPNLGMDGRFFKGVHKLESELLVVLDVDAAFAGKPVAI